ncbi:hypothetical protein DPMN_153078 [Dreissena polymorpha]|uniref:Uncharacterized protein n=1 Tax=Dreissena polymorpha TaxID=45954 RepID=A0A9D4FN44_DREPO|nr:hypothetical protein DPMN_153078 [Dreissena polymorpha]
MSRRGRSGRSTLSSGRRSGREDRVDREASCEGVGTGDGLVVLSKNVNARVFTNQMLTGGRRTKTNPKTSPEPSDIYKTNLFTKFHDDWAKNVTFRVFTSFFYYINSRKLPPPPFSSHVIQLTGTIFELNSHIKGTNKNALPTGGHVFSPIWTIFELVGDINKTNVLTNFHDDWAKIVTSRVFTRKTAPPTGGHVFQQTGTTFELNQHII